jgi:hypothetical protein
MYLDFALSFRCVILSLYSMCVLCQAYVVQTLILVFCPYGMYVFFIRDFERTSRLSDVL